MNLIDKGNFNSHLEKTGEVGFVKYISHQIVYVSGLPNAKPKEIVFFETGEFGYITSLEEDSVSVLVFSLVPVKFGTRVVRAGEIIKIPVGKHLIGSCIDPLGNVVGASKPEFTAQDIAYRDFDVPPPGIVAREKINKPFETGVAVVDLMVPLGRGQRELVIGDKDTGKDDFLLQSMLSNAKQGHISIYVCVGKKKSDIRAIENFIKSNDIQNNSILIVSSSSDPLGYIYISIYSAMTIAEYFRDIGQESLIIFNSMTNHAKCYREISLLLNKFPGRNSYPGDIFYAHSRLLERGGNFSTKFGIRSITCLPVADTVESDISGYIQTNLMSITDGHVYFDKDLFDQGRRPSVNYFLSVTRVGRQTQSKIRWSLNRELNTLLILYEKAQNFAHFGGELNSGIKSTLNTGSRILKFFNQPPGKILQINVQILLFCLIWVGIINEDDLEKLLKITESAIQLYDKDAKFKENVDGVIESSSDFNNLLGRISTKAQMFLNYLEIGIGK